jgi:hypothetical protein
MPPSGTRKTFATVARSFVIQLRRQFFWRHRHSFINSPYGRSISSPGNVLNILILLTKGKILGHSLLQILTDEDGLWFERFQIAFQGHFSSCLSLLGRPPPHQPHSSNAFESSVARLLMPRAIRSGVDCCNQHGLVAADRAQ